MDNDEDDDGNFTKWMSSYWGHGVGEEHAKDRKRSFRRSSRNKADRRASLPCMGREEKEVHSHPRARRMSSDENSRTKVVGPECHISTIPELTECLEKRLRFNNQKGDADSICLICHEELWNGRGGIQELHCGHHFHKEAKWPEHSARPRSGSSAPACERGKEIPFCPGQEEYRLPRRQLSLRRQR
ncbi:leukemia NUP98 fusion partner 1-like isoform X3 [Sinocyclocheilus anshuiensis]|uniref:leukemia NUP98 fusion partner 1-like isoform X3 n=1 Tax=Sinocyclocheilus anshuiensis TaxID=1608454 RepID=UPI0007B7CE9E|nr:PREDICTED: leukemia NUP98 fusion partner 1-like isoform X3 [Sinocyclocheilus anshuiensis]